MGAEPKQWTVLVQRCCGASSSLEGWERLQASALSQLWVPPRGAVVWP